MSTVFRPRRHLHSTNAHNPTSRGSVRAKLLSGGVFVGSIGLAYMTVRGGSDRGREQKPEAPLSSLLRSYCVFSMCSIPFLVDKSSSILDFLTSVPGLKQIAYTFVRYTFFYQFVGGDTPQDCVPLLERLGAENKGGVLVYSVEVGQASADEDTRAARTRAKQIVKQTMQSIDVVADSMDAHSGTGGNRNLWVAIKLTGLIPQSQSLIHLSAHLTNSRGASPIAYPGCPTSSDLDFLVEDTRAAGSPLTEQDVLDLRELYGDLLKICMHCQEKKVKILIDAEHSWFEPAIGAIGRSLMCKFNSLSSTGNTGVPPLPLVYLTFQAYLRRNTEYLLQSLRDAEACDFALGVKLVRGAYQTLEIREHGALSVSPEPQPPVWGSKTETDQCYNDCVRILIAALQQDIQSSGPHPRIGVMFGTHNTDSCDLILEELVRRGLANKTQSTTVIPQEVTDRMTIAQLYGMSDALSAEIVERTRTQSPLVVKYVPYGALSEVMPYLSRRAVENKSVLGGGKAFAERKRAGKEIRRWFFER